MVSEQKIRNKKEPDGFNRIAFIEIIKIKIRD